MGRVFAEDGRVKSSQEDFQPKTGRLKTGWKASGEMRRQNPGGRSIHAQNSKLEKGGGGQGWLEEENRRGQGSIWAVSAIGWME